MNAVRICLVLAIVSLLIVLGSADSPAVKTEIAVAHLGAVLRDFNGFALMKKKGAQVSKILTSNQKHVVDNFTCCLLPPYSMDDPVRVGQADLQGWQVETLEKERMCPDAWWETGRERALDFLEQAALVKDPGMTREKLKKERERVAKIFEEAHPLGRGLRHGETGARRPHRLRRAAPARAPQGFHERFLPADARLGRGLRPAHRRDGRRLECQIGPPVRSNAS